VTAGSARTALACPRNSPEAAVDSRRPPTEGKGQDMVAAAVPGSLPEETDGPMTPLPKLLGDCPTATPGDCPAAFTVITNLVQKSATKASAWHGEPAAQWPRKRRPRRSSRRSQRASTALHQSSKRRQQVSASPSLPTLKGFPPVRVTETAVAADEHVQWPPPAFLSDQQRRDRRPPRGSTTPAPATPLKGAPGRAAQSGTSPPARAVGPTALPRNWAKRPTAASKPPTHLHADLTRSTVIWDPGPGLPSSPLEKCSRSAPKSRWVHGLKHTAPGSARRAFGLPVGNAPGNPQQPRRSVVARLCRVEGYWRDRQKPRRSYPVGTPQSGTSLLSAGRGRRLHDLRLDRLWCLHSPRWSRLRHRCDPRARSQILSSPNSGQREAPWAPPQLTQVCE